MRRIDLGTREFTVCGRTVVATVYATVELDDIDPADTADPAAWDSPDDYRAYLRKFETGALTMCLIGVHAWFGGEVEGTDYLGGCEIASPDDWRQYADTYGMVDNAVAELAAKLESLVNKLRA